MTLYPVINLLLRLAFINLFSILFHMRLANSFSWVKVREFGFFDICKRLHKFSENVSTHSKNCFGKKFLYITTRAALYSSLARDLSENYCCSVQSRQEWYAQCCNPVVNHTIAQCITIFHSGRHVIEEEEKKYKFYIKMSTSFPIYSIFVT